MANCDCPFPAAEHRPVPEDALGVLEDELRLYDDPVSMRLNIVGLSRVYQETRMMRGFQRCAHLMTIASTAYGMSGTEIETTTARVLDPDFYGGEVLAAHCSIRPQSHFNRRRTYAWDPMEQFASADEEDGFSRSDLHAAVDAMAEFRTITWEKLFKELDEVSQTRIIEVALRLQEDQNDTAEHENSFMAGFMYAAYRIGNFLRNDE